MARHSQTITTAKAPMTASPGHHDHGEAKSTSRCIVRPDQNAARSLVPWMLGLPRDGSFLLGRGPGDSGPLPVLVPLPFPLPGKATRIDVGLAGSPGGILQPAGRLAHPAVLPDLQLGGLAGRAELVLGHQDSQVAADHPPTLLHSLEATHVQSD